jgi:SH3 domain protein
LLCLYGIGQAWAVTRYVTDQSEVTMRRGESTDYKIERMLPSGEAVDELSTNKETGYSRIRTQDGTTGYVLTRQLLDEPTARDRLAAMEARLAELQQAPDQLAEKLAELQSEHQALEETYTELKGDKERLDLQLASIDQATAEAVSINQRRLELQDENTKLKGELERLKGAIKEAENQTQQRWFLIGAGVAGAGILIGLILPRMRFRRRKSSWGSL